MHSGTVVVGTGAAEWIAGSSPIKSGNDDTGAMREPTQ